MTGATFVCACCGETFVKGRTDEEADAEMRERFTPEEIDGGPLQTVCEECATLIYQWLAQAVKP
jgi:hypothetical protein